MTERRANVWYGQRHVAELTELERLLMSRGHSVPDGAWLFVSLISMPLIRAVCLVYSRRTWRKLHPEARG